MSASIAGIPEHIRAAERERLSGRLTTLVLANNRIGDVGRAELAADLLLDDPAWAPLRDRFDLSVFKPNSVHKFTEFANQRSCAP